MSKISLKAYKLRKDLGEINYENVRHWIYTHTKYSVVGVEREKLPLQAKNVIFIDEYMSDSDAVEFLICEIGYIVLENINSKFKNDDEKEENVGKFVQLVYKPKKIPYLLYLFWTKKLWLYGILAIIFIQSVCCAIKYKVETAVKNPVYITQGSNKYHTKNCGSIKNSTKMAIEKNDAEKIFEKCSLCDPK